MNIYEQRLAILDEMFADITAEKLEKDYLAVQNGCGLKVSEYMTTPYTYMENQPISSEDYVGALVGKKTYVSFGSNYLSSKYSRYDLTYSSNDAEYNLGLAA